jgi:hypothetical protein
MHLARLRYYNEILVDVLLDHGISPKYITQLIFPLTHPPLGLSAANLRFDLPKSQPGRFQGPQDTCRLFFLARSGPVRVGTCTFVSACDMSM